MYIKRTQLAGDAMFDPAMVIRAWLSVSSTPATILGSHNVTSFSRTSAGKYIITWSRALVASAYTQVLALSTTDSAATGVTHPGYDRTASSEPLQTTTAGILVEAGTADGVSDSQLLTAVLLGPA